MPNLKIRLKLSGTFQSRSDERTFMKQVEAGVPAFINNLLRGYPGQIEVTDQTLRGIYGDDEEASG